jgi:hypothetical protein
MMMAGIFLERLKALDPSASEPLMAADQACAFNWVDGRSPEHA